jgi:CO/xanthine dehydrogenase FAD-binding subunit
MILARHQPASLEAALQLLGRKSPLTFAMGGGFFLARADLKLEVVELGAFHLNGFEKRGKYLEIGATASPQRFLDYTDTPTGLLRALQAAGPGHFDNVTSAGALVGSDGRSVFTAALLAMDAQVNLAGESQAFELGQVLHMRIYFPGLPALHGKLITGITINTETSLFFEAVHLNNSEQPAVILAAARWSSGRIRVVVSGWGRSPRLALDAPEPGGMAIAVSSALEEAGDEVANAGERIQAAAGMVARASKELGV